MPDGLQGCKCLESAKLALIKQRKETKMKTEREEIKVRIDAGYRLVGVETRDDSATLAAIREIAVESGRRVSVYEHTMKGDDDSLVPKDCMAKLTAFLSDESARVEEERIVVLRDVACELVNGEVVAWIKKIVEAEVGKGHGAVVLVVGRSVQLGSLLADFGCVLPVVLPCHKQIVDAVSKFAETHGCDITGGAQEKIVEALKGVPVSQIARLLGMTFVRKGALQPADLLLERAAMLGKDGLLEPVDLSGFDFTMGGMANLRGYLTHVSHILANREAAAQFGVDIPRGVLLAGMPGCGKSLAARLAAQMFGFPLLRLDTGRLMGKYVGESERNLREALSIAEAQSPCVLWIDEIEKAFAGVGRDSDNGVATRLFGGFLTWMAERTASVFTFATANDICGLPPELMRRGRFDEIFYVDFPNAGEAAEIISEQLKRRKCSLAVKDIRRLADEAAARGFSGADLESVIRTGVATAYEAWLEGSRGFRAVDIADFNWAMCMVKSTKESMGPKVEELRARFAEFQLTPASQIERSRRRTAKA